jgi:hypothetical protein
VPDVVVLSPDETAAKAAAQAATQETTGNDDGQQLETQAGSGATLLERIHAAGVRNADTKERVGYDMQQNAEELAQFLAWCVDAGVQSVYEIGAGVSAGLAKFMVKDMGWTVTSLDVNVPESTDLFDHPNWLFIQGDSATEAPPLQAVDLLFIDGDHSYEAAKRDHDRFGDAAKIVAFHDIAPGGYFPDGAAKYWRDIAYTKAGNLRKNFHEAIAEGSKHGIGWFVRE